MLLSLFALLAAASLMSPDSEWVQVDDDRDYTYHVRLGGMATGEEDRPVHRIWALVNALGEGEDMDGFRIRSSISEALIDCETGEHGALQARYYAGQAGQGESRFEDLRPADWTLPYSDTPEERMVSAVCEGRAGARHETPPAGF